MLCLGGEHDAIGLVPDKAWVPDLKLSGEYKPAKEMKDFRRYRGARRRVQAFQGEERFSEVQIKSTEERVQSERLKQQTKKVNRFKACCPVVNNKIKIQQQNKNTRFVLRLHAEGQHQNPLSP